VGLSYGVGSIGSGVRIQRIWAKSYNRESGMASLVGFEMRTVGNRQEPLFCGDEVRVVRLQFLHQIPISYEGDAAYNTLV